MSARRSDQEKVRSLIALRVSDDLTAEETARVDECVRYDADCKTTLKSYTQILSVLREAGAEPTAVDDRPSLWSRIEPRLGPAGRYRRRRFDWISTRQMAVAAAALFGLTIYTELTKPQLFVAGQGMAIGAPNRNVDFIPDGGGAVPLANPAVGIPARPVLGLIVQDVDASLRQRVKNDKLTGAAVVSVLEGLPAEQIGIRPDDVILGINGIKIHSADELIRALEMARNADPIRIEVQRNGKSMLLEIRRTGPRSGVNPAANSRVYAVLRSFATSRAV